MTHRSLAALAAALVAVTASPALAAPAETDRKFRMHTPSDPAHAKGFDNLRFGMTNYLTPGITDLFTDRGAVSLGMDYHLGGGWAIALDSQNLYKDWGGSAYFLDITPIQAKYRLGIPLPNAAFLPFMTLGAGPTVMALLDGGAPRGGIGLGATASAGIMLQDALTLEGTFNIGQVGAIPYQGIALRFGTGFGSLGNMVRVAGDPDLAVAAPLGEGVVESVVGDRLTLVWPNSDVPAAGAEIAIYVGTDAETRIAKARVESVVGGRVRAKVIQATEPVRNGYHARGW